MKFHPALLMLLVWAICIGLFYALPFQLENRSLSVYGFLILSLFIATFCGAALLAGPIRPQAPRVSKVTLDFKNTDRLLIIVSIISLIAFVLDVRDRDLLDFSAAFEDRDARAQALMAGTASESSIWFQIGFFCYPAAFTYLVREIAFRARPKAFDIFAFGILPTLMGSLVTGGRSPLLYAIILAVYAYNLRKQLFARAAPVAQRRPRRPQTTEPPRRKAAVLKLGPWSKGALGIISALAMVYFVQVFVARADFVGGIESVFGIAKLYWGVSFVGPLADLMFDVLGFDTTYLIFVFGWYSVQGFVMSNVIFTEYDGPMLMGAYGIDLGSALFRRLNPGFLADGFAGLASINTYGFIPSAFGSLYVDLKFLGLLPAALWGWISGRVYRRVREGSDPRWLMLVPFVVIGIVFSVVNTPLGFSNGFMIHFWLLVGFLLIKVKLRDPLASAALGRKT